MSFKNAIQILISKFSVVWSLLGYLLIIGLPIGGVVLGLWYPMFSAWTHTDYVGEFAELFHQFVAGNHEITILQIIQRFGEVADNLLSTILDYPGFLVVTLVVILLVGRLLLGMKDLAVCECVNAKMTANRDIGFWEGFFTNLRSSMKLVLSRTLFTLPFDAGTFGILYLINMLFREIGLGWLAPFAVIFGGFVLVPFKKLNFGLWPCYIVAEGNRTFSSMRRGLKLAYRFGGRVYSLLVVTQVLGFLVNVFFGVFTLGVGLLISVPVYVAFESVLMMTVLYTHTGKRYYLDPCTVFTPPAVSERGAK